MSRPAHPSPRMRAQDHLGFELANLRQIQLFFLFFLFYFFLRPGTGFGGGGFFHKQDQMMRGASRGGRPPRSANLPSPREPPPTATTRPSTKTFSYLGPPLDAPTALSDSLERRTDRAAPGRKPRSGWRSGQKDSLYLLLPGRVSGVPLEASEAPGPLPTKWVRTGEATGFLMDAPLGVVEVKGRVPAEGNP